MGLDLVEFVIAVEGSFGLEIPNDVAADLVTPRHLIDHLVSRLPPGDVTRCLGQAAFYRVRRAAMAEFRLARAVIRPTTPWPAILPTFHVRDAWARLGEASALPKWPSLALFSRFAGNAATVGSTSLFVAAYCASALKDADVGWTRREVERVVRELMRHQFGIRRLNLDAHFVRDLKLD
jgi:hypothetical protein